MVSRDVRDAVIETIKLFLKFRNKLARISSILGGIDLDSLYK